jgi:hypothetical protein
MRTSCKIKKFSANMQYISSLLHGIERFHYICLMINVLTKVEACQRSRLDDVWMLWQRHLRLVKTDLYGITLTNDR